MATSDESTESPTIWGQPITNRRRRVRVEAVNEANRPHSDSEVVSEFDQYVRDKNRMSTKFENGTSSNSHRFSDAYAREKYGETLGADREMYRDADNLHCAIVTRRGRWWNDDNSGRPIIDFLDDLRDSHRNITQWYRRNLDQFARVTTIEHHENSYPHIHDHLWHWGKLSQDDLAGAVSSHVRNSPVATAEGHPKDGAAQAWKASPQHPDGDDSRVARTSLVTHATKHLCWDGACNSVPAKRRVLSALWAANVNSFTPDSTFSEYVEKSQDSDMSDGLGKYVGIETPDGTTIKKEDMDGSGGTKFVMAEPDETE